ncbi:hypothetical protein ABZP36_022440 [Zizania latifolia]
MDANPKVNGTPGEVRIEFQLHFESDAASGRRVINCQRRRLLDPRKHSRQKPLAPLLPRSNPRRRSMAAAAAASQGISPGFKFSPSDDELVKLFLLPYLLRQPLPADGLVVVDDPYKAPPWSLLQRNDREMEDDGYFLAPVAGEGRQARVVEGGGKWITQRVEGNGELLVDGMAIEWQKMRLNFHYGEGRSGSTGWVMHEYAVVKPPGIGASHRASYIAFTGHGEKRKRVPDGHLTEDDGQKRKRVPDGHLTEDDGHVAEVGQTTAPPPAAMCGPPQSDQEYFSDQPPNVSCIPQHQNFFPEAEQYRQEQEGQNFFEPIDQERNQEHEGFGDYISDQPPNVSCIPQHQNSFPEVEQYSQEGQNFFEPIDQERDYGQPNYQLPDQSNQEHDGCAYGQQFYFLPQQSNQEFEDYASDQPNYALPDQEFEEFQGYASQQFVGREEEVPVPPAGLNGGDAASNDGGNAAALATEPSSVDSVQHQRDVAPPTDGASLTEEQQQQLDDMAVVEFLKALLT